MEQVIAFVLTPGDQHAARMVRKLADGFTDTTAPGHAEFHRSVARFLEADKLAQTTEGVRPMGPHVFQWFESEGDGDPVGSEWDMGTIKGLEGAIVTDSPPDASEVAVWVDREDLLVYRMAPEGWVARERVDIQSRQLVTLSEPVGPIPVAKSAASDLSVRGADDVPPPDQTEAERKVGGFFSRKAKS